jgi:hypothetical protein
MIPLPPCFYFILHRNIRPYLFDPEYTEEELRQQGKIIARLTSSGSLDQLGQDSGGQMKN